LNAGKGFIDRGVQEGETGSKNGVNVGCGGGHLNNFASAELRKRKFAAGKKTLYREERSA